MKKGCGIATLFVFLLFPSAHVRSEPVLREIWYQKSMTLSCLHNCTLRFSLWDAETGGIEVWSEEKTVRPAKGVVKTWLGSKEPLNPADFERQLWVQVERKTVRGFEALGEREPLGIVPYAMWSQTTGGVGAALPSNSVLTLDGSSGIGSSLLYSRGDHKHGIGTGAITSANLQDGCIKDADVSPTAAIAYTKLAGVAAAAHHHDSVYVNEGQANSVTSAMIADGAVGNADIAAGAAISGGKLASDGSVVKSLVAGTNITSVVNNNNGSWTINAADGRGSGDITAVNAGTGLDGGGAWGSVTLNVEVPLELSGASPEAVISGKNAFTGPGGSFLSDGNFSTGVLGGASATGDSPNYGGYFYANGDQGRGVYGHAVATGDVKNYGAYFEAAGNFGRGVFGLASATGDYSNIGGHFQAKGDRGRGVFGSASGSSGRGVEGSADALGNVTNYGGYFVASGNYGVGVYGWGRGYDFLADGPGIDFHSTSSVRWKRNIREIDGALDKVTSLRGVYFDWDEEHGGQHDMGFIAEEVGKVVPEIVGYELDGVYATGLDYGAMTPMLLQAIKELRGQIEELKARIAILEGAQR